MTVALTVVLIAVICLAAFYAVPRGRAVRGVLSTLVMLVVGWMLSAIFFLMPTQGMTGDQSLLPMVAFYLVAFTVLFGLLGMTALALAGVEHRARTPALFGFLAGSVLGVLLITLALVDLQASGPGAGEVGGIVGALRGVLNTFERATGESPFRLLATAAILVPWIVGMGVAALRTRAYASAPVSES